MLSELELLCPDRQMVLEAAVALGSSPTTECVAMDPLELDLLIMLIMAPCGTAKPMLLMVPTELVLATKEMDRLPTLVRPPPPLSTLYLPFLGPFLLAYLEVMTAGLRLAMAVGGLMPVLSLVTILPCVAGPLPGLMDALLTDLIILLVDPWVCRCGLVRLPSDLFMSATLSMTSMTVTFGNMVAY